MAPVPALGSPPSRCVSGGGRGAGRLGSQGPPLRPRVLGCPPLPASPFPYMGLVENPQARASLSRRVACVLAGERRFLQGPGLLDSEGECSKVEV